MVCVQQMCMQKMCMWCMGAIVCTLSEQCSACSALQSFLVLDCFCCTQGSAAATACELSMQGAHIWFKVPSLCLQPFQYFRLYHVGCSSSAAPHSLLRALIAAC